MLKVKKEEDSIKDAIAVSILKEADILRKEHPSKDCRFFADSVYRYLKKRGSKSNMKNRYGVDVPYFWKELNALMNSLSNRTPQELRRYLICLAEVADGVTSPWISVKDAMPKESTPMEIHRVLVRTREDINNKSWHVGWFQGGHLQEWRIENSPSQWDVLEWMEVPN